MTGMARFGDSRVEQLVRNALMNDSRIDLSEIQVRVENGVVYLTGTVDSAAERRAAHEDLMSATEVEQVVDQLQLRNYVERTDEELAHCVRQALMRDIDVDPSSIVIGANNGAVTLSGSVSSYAQKLGAENVAWWTPGVTEVANRLDVAGGIEPPDEPDL